MVANVGEATVDADPVAVEFGRPNMEFEKLDLAIFNDKAAVMDRVREVSIAAAEHFIRETPTDGIPYWDTGAPGLAQLGDYQDRPAEPYNAFEPVDSSAAAISAPSSASSS